MNARAPARRPVEWLRTTAAMAVLAVASGCVTSGVYPDAWASKVETRASGCPVIDGEYLDEGEYFEMVDDDGLVRHTTTFGELAACADCPFEAAAAGDTAIGATAPNRTFRLRLIDDVLKVSATAADGSMRDFEQKVRKSCSDSMMLVDAEWWSSLEEEDGQEMFGATLGMSVLMRGSWRLGRAEDGSLLVRQSAAGSLLVFYWPILPISFKEWVRFPPAPASPAAEELAPVQVALSPARAEMPPEGH